MARAQRILGRVLLLGATPLLCIAVLVACLAALALCIVVGVLVALPVCLLLPAFCLQARRLSAEVPRPGSPAWYVARMSVGSKAAWHLQPARRPTLAAVPRERGEQATTMWQERARNLESQVEQLLALPAHEEEPVPGRHWWQWWHRKAE